MKAKYVKKKIKDTDRATFEPVFLIPFSIDVILVTNF